MTLPKTVQQYVVFGKRTSSLHFAVKTRPDAIDVPILFLPLVAQSTRLREHVAKVTKWVDISRAFESSLAIDGAEAGRQRHNRLERSQPYTSICGYGHALRRQECSRCHVSAPQS